MAVPVLDALVWSKLGAIVLTFFIGIGAGVTLLVLGVSTGMCSFIHNLSFGGHVGKQMYR